MELLNVLFRTIFFYFFVILAYRIMGKREIAELGIVDLIVTIMIAEIVAFSIDNLKNTIVFAVLPITVLVVLEMLIARISTKHKKINILFNGKPSFIIYDGKVCFKEMMRQRYSLQDLLYQLRQKEIKSISEVEYAILENTGQLSIFKYKNKLFKGDDPLPVILDGIIQTKTLQRLNIDKNALLNKLNKDKLTVDSIFYAFYKGRKLYIIKRSDLI